MTAGAGRAAGDRRAGQKIRWIEIGSQYMAAADKLVMRDLFPNARIIQHYCLTEASRSVFLDITAAPEAGLGSVGAVPDPNALRIGDNGAISIRGDQVALGQVMEGARFAALPMPRDGLKPATGARFGDGRLYYLGRLDDQINLAGIKLGTEDWSQRSAGLSPLPQIISPSPRSLIPCGAKPSCWPSRTAHATSPG
jgi:non-ribosomal peptide synthetase component F